MDALTLALRVATASLGYKELHPQQERVVRSFVGGNDVFVSLPTGSGKSLCYCLLPRVFDELKNAPGTSIVVVISPLVSLMKDQVSAMCKRNVSAVYVGDVNEEGFRDICRGKKQLIYMSPESLLSDVGEWRDVIQSPVFQSNLVGIVIDEAHCVTKWYVWSVNNNPCL